MGKLLAAALIALITGCNYGAASFICQDNGQCGGGGRCELSSGGGLCSFPDGSCTSGFRYGDLAGPQSNQCVGAQPVDASIDAPPDAPPDVPPDAPPDARACFGTGLLTICLRSGPTAPVMIASPTTIDTTDSPMCAEVMSGGNYCVLAGTTITIDARLRATGTRPLVLIAADSITTGALIDVGSHRGQTPETGAGADPTCVNGTAPAGGGGGAGGSFIGLGGTGGLSVGVGGQPGVAVGSVTELRGGCRGQDGAGGANERGIGGHGGGAVFLIAVNRITIGGGINAAGEGGRGGVGNASGGGGGGAGGMIGLDAPTVSSTSQLLATGGGGAEGSDDGPNTPGTVGADPLSTSLGAPGGSGGSTRGGDGGVGALAAANPGLAGPGLAGDASGQNHGGGGGGGGGAGLIKAPAGAALGNQVAPPAIP